MDVGIFTPASRAAFTAHISITFQDDVAIAHGFSGGGFLG